MFNTQAILMKVGIIITTQHELAWFEKISKYISLRENMYVYWLYKYYKYLRLRVVFIRSIDDRFKIVGF